MSFIRELYVIRHGIADEASEHDGIDEERQLTKKGRERVKGVAKYLLAREVRPDVILSSPLARARETAEVIGDVCLSSKSYTSTELLKPAGSYDELITFLNGMQAERIALVGHEPFLSGFISYCLARSRRPFVRMKKAGVACLTCEDRIDAGDCLLAWLMGPAQMQAED